ncbi:hypothetical protein BIFBRE_03177 [Bifidobacterium breve DSM 20213 = JCM 1192]|uniref:Uncharacterized protein n=1 Tax=Bifidobacterium breve DSM 20213 = JCM 1192 TaxID=518634 RepID=D4BM84_BIFBR|nr:hypothetical protein BIFBRE_03177 [Bifidobacterium breve DSM 20213 = JCM 1192]
MHGIALAQAILLDLAHGDVHVVRARQIAGRTHERIGIEHIDDTGHRYQVFLRLLAAVIAVLAIIETTIVLAGVFATVTTTHTAVAAVIAIIAVVAISVTVTAATAELAVFALFTIVGRFVVLLRGQRGQNVIQIAHGLVAAVRRTATATRLILIMHTANERSFGVITTVAAALGSGCLAQIEGGEQIAGLIGLLARLAAGSFIIAAMTGIARFFSGLIGCLTAHTTGLRGLGLFGKCG